MSQRVGSPDSGSPAAATAHANPLGRKLSRRYTPQTAPAPSGVNTGDLVDEQAVRILGTLDGASAATLHGFGEGLKYVDGPAS